MQVVAYEACRLFRDCLTTPDHARSFDTILTDALRKHWGTAVEVSAALFSTLAAVSAASGQYSAIYTLFCDVCTVPYMLHCICV